MITKLLNRNNNTAILIAGIISLIIGVGIARFAFTALLPFMLTDYLSVISKFVLYINSTWEIAWVVLSVFGFVITLYAIHILSFDKVQKSEVKQFEFNTSIFSFYVIVLTIVYFTEGVGLVVQDTFLPDIINSMKDMAEHLQDW